MEEPPGRPDAVQAATVLPLLDLPAPCLRAVVLGLWADPRDAAALSCCCTATSQLLADQQLWKELLTRRYGASSLPGEEPAGPPQQQPMQPPGWVFYQGLDASAEGDKPAEGWGTLQQLADKASSQGGEAFHTSGVIISDLPSRQSWRRTSYRPTEGLFVKEQLAAALQLEGLSREPAGPSTNPTSSPTNAPWPPAVQGWVFFPSCYSGGYCFKEGRDNMAAHPTLEALLTQAAGDSRVVAVTTAGETKNRLRPQWCWATTPRYDEGMFVKTAVVHSMRLRVPSPGVDYRAAAARLASLRLCAAQMDAVWLNDQYLTLKEVPAGLGCRGTALKLNNVWWLDISGDIVGVPPGQYEVVWVLALPTSSYLLGSTASFSLSATAESLHLEPLPPTMNTAGGPAAAAAAAAAAGGSGSRAGPSAADASSNSSSITLSLYLDQLRQRLRPLPRQRGLDTTGWGSVSAGVITASDTSRVHLRFWSHDDWKSDIQWAYVELRPVLSRAQQQEQQRRRQQWARWWEHRGGSGVGGGSGGDGGIATRLRSRVGRMLGLQPGFLG